MPFCYTVNMGLFPYAIAADLILSLLLTYFLVYAYTKTFVGKKRAAIATILEFLILSIGIFKLLTYTIFTMACI
jgi:hypothetical protein